MVSVPDNPPAVVEEYLRILEREGGGGVCVEVVVRKLAELQSVGLLVRSNPKLEMEPPKDIPAKDKHLVKCATGTDAGVIVTSDSTHLNNREMRQTLESSYSIKVRLPHEYRDLCGGAARA